MVDDREVDPDLIDALRAQEGVEVHVQRLKTGDYEVDGRCLFERKTMQDFACSLADGRLFGQAYRLAKCGQLAAFILEGRSSDLAGSQMRREALQGALITLTLIFGLPVLRSLDREETIRLMLYAARQLRRQNCDVLLLHTRKPRGKRRLQLRILQSLPGIGPTRAQQLLDHFGSAEAALTAPKEALQALPGIGENTATLIRWAIGPDSADERREI